MPKEETTKTHERFLIFDESGNLGSSGRYFVIACIDTHNIKSLHNVMHKKLGLAKSIFRELSSKHANEIKANEAYPCIKYHILECIARKDLTISYIVADLHHVKPSLLDDKNIFYNYMMKLLVERLITKKDNGTIVNIICDNHTTKVASKNSLAEYLKLALLYDKNYDVTLNIKLLDSDANDAYIIQAADYVANALFSYYEYGTNLYYQRFKGVIYHSIEFPWKLFGK